VQEPGGLCECKATFSRIALVHNHPDIGPVHFRRSAGVRWRSTKHEVPIGGASVLGDVLAYSLQAVPGRNRSVYFGSFFASLGESKGIYSFTPGRPFTDSQMLASAAWKSI